MNASGNVLDTLISAVDGGVIRQIAASVGLPEQMVIDAARSVVPALAGGITRNLAQPGGADALTRALQSGDHARYVQEPGLLDRPEAIADGNAILGHVLGSKEVSRNVAGFAAGQTGIDPALLKTMLPMLASAVMGVLAAKTVRTGPAGINPSAPDSGALGGVFGGFLDVNKDGSPVDDVLNLAKRFFHRSGG